MLHSNSSLRAELGSTLGLLQDSLRTLADYITDRAHAAWLWQPPSRTHSDAPLRDLSHRETLDRIALAFQLIKYEDGQDPHESRIYPGIVAVPAPCMELADAVNHHKAVLARVLKAMDGRTEIGISDPRTGDRGERPLREVALEAFYFRRLHHWQATRRIEVLRESAVAMGTVEYVGFMWATSREVRRTSRESLLKQALAPGATLLSEEDIQIVKGLPDKEPLAIVRPGHTIPKANIRWQPRSATPATTRVRVAVLPFILVGNQLPDRLRKLPPSPASNAPRLARTDIEIESSPLCHTLPVYRYLKPLRSSKRQLNPKLPDTTPSA